MAVTRGFRANLESGGSRHRSALAVTAVGVALSLGLAGCTSSGGGGQSGSAAPMKNPPKITIGEAFVHPADLEVPGLSGQRALSSTGSEARWAYLPGEQPFNDTLSDLVGSYLQAQAQTRDLSYSPEAQPQNAELLNRGCIAGSTALTGREILDNPDLALTPGTETQLAIACEPILASGTVFGERLRFVRGNASEVVSDAVEVLYTDTATGDVARGRDLVLDSALPVLYDSLFELLKLEQPMSGDEVIPPSAETLHDLKESLSNVGFNAKGDMVVTVDRNFIAVIGSGNPAFTPAATTLVIPAARATELLEPLGQTISAAVAQDLEWSGPAPVPSGEEYVDCGLVPCVAVTYDDGPSYLTPSVLDVYAERDHAAATFFVLGQNIPGNEEILARAAAEGNEIANHSWDHPAFTTVSDEGIRSQIDRTNELITEATGQTVKVMRPPYGDLNDRTLATTGLPAILWSVDTNDWQHPGGDVVVRRAVDEARPDGIILMHDIHDDTVAVAGQVADELLERGYTLVTVSQLMEGVDLGPTFYYSAEGLRS